MIIRVPRVRHVQMALVLAISSLRGIPALGEGRGWPHGLPFWGKHLITSQPLQGHVLDCNYRKSPVCSDCSFYIWVPFPLMVPLAASQPNYLAEIEVSEPGRTDNSLGWREEEEKGSYAGTASGWWGKQVSTVFLQLYPETVFSSIHTA